jgi:hypothetical protein
MVVGAWSLNALQTAIPNESTAAIVSAVAPRSPIDVRDSNGDGVEDWKEPFLTASPVFLSRDDDFLRTDNLTQNVGITLVEQLLLQQASGLPSAGSGAIVAEAIGNAEALLPSMAAPTLASLTIIDDTTTSTLRSYANTLATILESSTAGGARHELLAARDAATLGGEQYQKEVLAVAAMYDRAYEQTIGLPVPEVFQAEHLALATALNSLRTDIRDLATPLNDPLKALVRLKTYEQNALALGLALQGLHRALLPYPTLFTADDAALYFARFADLRLPVPNL